MFTTQDHEIGLVTLPMVGNPSITGLCELARDAGPTLFKRCRLSRTHDSEVNQLNLETFAGVALAAISFALVILARVQLGKSFAVTPKANDLVTHGLYSRLQHPMYVFVDLTVCGIALGAHRWYVLLLLVILMPLQTRNVRRERNLLQEKFGERYEIYRRATWF